ncbi:MAG TPA: alpha-1,2-fucosyltransferase [Bacillota bacterium]|nr:alpha-1,2-fucosyltransferase [Bacillota bacterium]
MIITRLISGLGNQLFQYALGRRIADFHQTPLKLDLTWFEELNFPKYMLGRFMIDEKIAVTEEIEMAKAACHFREDNFRFEPGFLKTPPLAYLDGYWQSERYFREIEGVLRKEFTLKKPPSPANRRMEEKILSCEAVSVHIRRGDYLTSPIHQVCTLDYYDNCIKIITSMIPKPHFFVFSDDWSWAEQNFKPARGGAPYPVTMVALNPIEEGQEDLRLMSLCRYHIIANSTFSWWGAWLSNYRRKIVCAPNQWLNSDQYDTSYIIPETWYPITT